MSIGPQPLPKPPDRVSRPPSWGRTRPVTVDTGVTLGEFQKVVKISDFVADYGSAACPRHVIEGSVMARSNSKTQRQGSYGITSSQCQAETSLTAA